MDTTKADKSQHATPEECTAPSFNIMLFKAIPWFTVAVNAWLLCNLADVQTRVMAAESQSGASLGQIWAVLPAAMAAGLASGWFTNLKGRAIAAAIVTAVGAGLALIGPGALIALLAVPIAIIAIHGINAIKGVTTAPSREAFAGALLALICAYASYNRFEFLPRVLSHTPDPDFGSYLMIAQNNSGWNTTFREPLYIWVLQLMDLLGGELNQSLLRIVSIGTSLAAIAAIFQMCRKKLNLTTALIAASLYALFTFPVYTACRGLREDLIVCLSLLFMLVSWDHLKRPVTWKSLTIWGLLGAANVLLRYSSMSFVLVTIAGVAAFRSFTDIKLWSRRARFILPAVLTVTLFAPYLWHCRQLYGQSFFLSNFAARFYANEEFAGKHPDFPTLAEVAKDGYAGGVITPSEYVFKYHTTSEITERTWGGFVKTFFGKNFRESYILSGMRTLPGFLLVLHWIGIILLLFPRRIFLVFQMLLYHAPVFFLAAWPTFDPRLLIVAMAFNYITVATAIGIGIEEGRRLLNSDRGESPRSGKTQSIATNTKHAGRRKSR